MFTLQSPIKPKNYGLDKGIIQLTQLFGEMDLDYKLLGLTAHNGLDFRTKHFQDGYAPVLASHDGEIISEKDKQSDTAGRFVKILSPETTYQCKPCKIMTVYFHLKDCRHDKGTIVKAGQEIGTADNTGGFTSGSHLHFGVYVLWKYADNVFRAEENNGMAGAYDPLPFMLDNNVCQCGDSMWGRTFYYNGRKISRSEVDGLIPQQYKT